MAKDRKGSLPEKNGKEEQRDEEEATSKGEHGRKSKRKNEGEIDDIDQSSEDEEDKKLSRRKKKKTKRISRRSSRRRRSDEDSSSSLSSSYSSDSDSDGSDYSSEDRESEDERHRRKRKERERRRRRKEREYEKERRRKSRDKEKERKRRKKDKEKKKKEKGKKGAVTNSWGKYGIIRETDMWNKRPEFSAWLAEVKQVNLETLLNREEKQMFKEFMEDHNTATFPSKKYYSLDAYHRREMDKEMKKGFKRVLEAERTVFNDEEQRRQELMIARGKQKEEQVEALKHSMQTGMAQAMKEQAQLREEMAYQYKLGNFEAAAAIQRRLDPDVAM